MAPAHPGWVHRPAAPPIDEALGEALVALVAVEAAEGVTELTDPAGPGDPHTSQ